MTRKTRRTLRVGFRWMILGAIAWSLIVTLVGVIADVVTDSAVDQAEGYNQAIHVQLPKAAYAAYRRQKSPQARLED